MDVNVRSELLFVCAEGIVPRLSRRLPLGGSHLTQLGFVLGLAVGMVEIWDTYTHIIR